MRQIVVVMEMIYKNIARILKGFPYELKYKNLWTIDLSLGISRTIT